VRTALRITVAAIVSILLMCAILSSPSAAADVAKSSPASPFMDVDQPPHDESDGTVDLLGNEVIDAVAKYRLDATGALYELHSPQTELPRLGSPKT
jgi:hypothetical protein